MAAESSSPVVSNGDLRVAIEVEPLVLDQAVEVMEALVDAGYRVELYAGVSERAGGRFYSLRVLIVEPLLGHQMTDLIEVAERHGRPIYFSDSDGVRIR